MTVDEREKIVALLKSAAVELCRAHEAHAAAAPPLEECVRETQAEFQAEQRAHAKRAEDFATIHCWLTSLIDGIGGVL